MISPELKTIASAIAKAGAPGIPCVLLTRDADIFEVDFPGLEFAIDSEITGSDRATMELAKALVRLSPADIQSFLGLDAPISERLVRRLLDEGLLEECVDNPIPEYVVPDSESPNDGVVGFFKRLFVPNPGPIGLILGGLPSAVTPPRAKTTARQVRKPTAATTPLCCLGLGGRKALELGTVKRRVVRPARLLFIAEPFLFVGIEGTGIDTASEWSPVQRPTPLRGDRIPSPFRDFDTAFARHPDDRLRTCGIGSSLGSFAGQFVGIDPGKRWEVRQFAIPYASETDPISPQFVIAGFPSSDPSGLFWQAFTWLPTQTHSCQTDASSFLDPKLQTLASLLSTVRSDSPIPAANTLRDNAFSLRCDSQAIRHSIGLGLRPEEAFVQATAPPWRVGIRTRAVPANAEAARAAFYEFLRRREDALRRDFDGTCAIVASNLIRYWGMDPGLPSADEAAHDLWHRIDLRAALCRRRYHRDLIAPYENEEGNR
ncbi:MAG: hypothetical protein FWD57_05480 [Polyangiaceae bacterium]|nr:hypothetical protein [Polyangiaceae bacterium]